MPSEEIERAMALARGYREHAYAPYSRYGVGAALITESGETFGAANVENASYGLTICAERNAAAAAVVAGHRKFRAIAVAGPSHALTAPCGACRQFLTEFGAGMVVAYTTAEGMQVTTLDALLPASFGPDSLQDAT